MPLHSESPISQHSARDEGVKWVKISRGVDATAANVFSFAKPKPTAKMAIAFSSLMRFKTLDDGDEPPSQTRTMIRTPSLPSSNSSALTRPASMFVMPPIS